MAVLDSCAHEPESSERATPAGNVAEVPENWHETPLVLSPPVLGEPILNCGTLITVSGVDPDAVVDVFSGSANDPDGSELVAGGAAGSWTYDSLGVRVYQLLDEREFEAGETIWARQRKEGVTSVSFPSIGVLSIAEAYPEGLPNPAIDPAPLYECGGAMAIRHCPPGGRVRIVSEQNGTLAQFGTPSNWVGISFGQPMFDLGDRIRPVSSICGNESDIETTVHQTVQSYPNEKLETLSEVRAYDGQEHVYLEAAVNGAFVSVRDGSNQPLGGSFAHGAGQEFAIETGALEEGQLIQIAQELCPGSMSVPAPVVVEPCSEMPPPVIRRPRPGEESVFLREFVSDAVVVVKVLDEETGALEPIGQGLGLQVGLDRALSDGDVVVLVREIAGCPSKAYVVKVTRSQHVVLFIVDGLGPEMLEDYLSGVWPDQTSSSGFEKLSDGRGRIFACDAQSGFPSHTIPNMTRMVTGQEATVTKVVSNRYYELETPEAKQQSAKLYDWMDKLGRGAAVYGFYDPNSPVSDPDADYPWDEDEAGWGAVHGAQHEAAGGGALDRYLAANGVRTVYDRLTEANLTSHVVHHIISNGAAHPLITNSGLTPQLNTPWTDGWSQPTSLDLAVSGLISEQSANGFYDWFDEKAVSKLVGEGVHTGLLKHWSDQGYGYGLPNLLTVYFAGVDHAEHVSGVGAGETPENTPFDERSPDWSIISRLDDSIHTIYEALEEYFPDIVGDVSFVIASDHSVVDVDPGSPPDYGDSHVISWSDIWAWSESSSGGVTLTPTQRTRDGGTAMLYGTFSESYVSRIVKNAGDRLLGLIWRENKIEGNANVWTGKLWFLARNSNGDVEKVDATTIQDKNLGALIANSFHELTFPGALLIASAKDLHQFGSKPSAGMFTVNLPGFLNAIGIDDIEKRNPIGDRLPGHGHHGYPVTTRNTFVVYSPFIEEDQHIGGVNIVDVTPTILSMLGATNQLGGMDGKPVLNTAFEIGSGFSACSGVVSWRPSESGDILRD